jgi:hypothetical protein
VTALHAGQIVLADWRDALPKEPNKLRLAIVLEDDRLFPDDYPNVILVPLSGDVLAAPEALTLAIEPTRAVRLAAATSVKRLRATPSRITTEQLLTIRRQIAVAIGLD